MTLSEDPETLAMVLIVDDDPTMRILARAALEPHGFSILEAESGAQALLLLETHLPQIVLLDVIMPSMDGFAVCSAIRRRPGGENLPVVMVTSLDDLDSITHAYKVGATDFITKPIDWVILSHRLRHMIRAGWTTLELRKSEARIRAILNVIPDLMLRIRKDGVLLDASLPKAMEFPLPVEKVLGMPLQEVWPSHVACATLKRIEKALETQSTEVFECEVEHDGSRTCWESRIVASGDDEVLHIVREITRRKKMEEELLKARKLEAVGILAGGIAHDFNNLLSIILGSIGMAQLDCLEDNPCHEWLSRAEREILRARDLTSQFITFSSGGEPLKRPVRIEDLVVETAHQVTECSPVQCDFLFPDFLWHVAVDAEQIKQVLHHLIRNAMEAMPRGGLIRIAAANVNIEADRSAMDPEMPAGRYVKVSIRDEGIGIPEMNLTKIFDPYFSTKERGTQKGMGLGLAIVYSIIKRHGGFVTAESESNAGSCFNVFLPAQERVLPGEDDSGARG